MSGTGSRHELRQSHAVPSLRLTSTSTIPPFAFDGDGQVAFTGNSYGPTGYEGPNTSFSNIAPDPSSGT